MRLSRPATVAGRPSPSQDGPSPTLRRIVIASLATPRFAIVATLSATGLALISALPTAIVDNPWFTRMTPVYAEQYFFWIATSVLAGILVATYLVPGTTATRWGGGIGGGGLAYLAIGCPICNKLIVGLLGVSGALNLFAPIQPLLGAVGLALTAVALGYRFRDLRRGTCRAASAVAG